MDSLTLNVVSQALAHEFYARGFYPERYAFKESEHPRDEDGQFAEKGAGKRGRKQREPETEPERAAREAAQKEEQKNISAGLRERKSREEKEQIKGTVESLLRKGVTEEIIRQQPPEIREELHSRFTLPHFAGDAWAAKMAAAAKSEPSEENDEGERWMQLEAAGGKEFIQELFRTALSRAEGDKDRAAQMVSAYLRGQVDRAIIESATKQ